MSRLIGIWVGMCCLLAGCARDAPKVEIDPTTRALLLEADAAFQHRRYEAALVLVDSAAARAPALAEAPFVRGNILMADGRFEEARSAFREVVELDPDFPEGWRRLGDAAQSLGRPEEAVDAYLREAAERPTARLWGDLGVHYAEAGVSDSARMAFDRAIALDSADADLQMMHGQFLEKIGRLDEALKASETALRLKPDNANYRFAVGAQLYRLGRLEEAERQLRQAAGAMPLHYPANYNLGQVLLRLGREDEAREILARADSTRRLVADLTAAEAIAAQHPNDPAIFLHLGTLYHRAERYDRATAAFERAEALAPGDPEAVAGLARVAMALGRTREAIQRFEGLLDQHPSRVEDRLVLGLAYAVSGDCTRARASWQRVLRDQPGHAGARGYLEGLCAFEASP